MSDGTATETAFVFRSIRGLFAVSLVVLVLSLPSASSPQDSEFTFAIAGDFGANLNTASVLSGMGLGTDFSIADGDFSYSQAGPEPTDGITPSPWCGYVAGRLPGAGTTYPFQLITGNHEVDGSIDGHIDNFARCLPNLIPSATGSGLCANRDLTLGAGGCYGVEYYFDYPETNPIVRFILVYGSSSDTIDGTKYSFSNGSIHYNWVSSVIDQAKASGLWTIAAVHMPCLTMGISGCSQSSLQRLFASKKVDLVINGHDHNYQRSKQLTCFSTTSYDPGCVIDDGSDSFYLKGQGTVYTIVGTGGASLFSVSTSNVLAPYFARWNHTTYGFLKVSLSQTRASVEFAPTGGGMFRDSFVIDESPQTLMNSFVFTPATPGVSEPVSFYATAFSGTPPYTFGWAYGDGESGFGASVTHTFLSEGSFNVTLTAYDSGALTASSSKIVVVLAVHTFTPIDDAFVREDTPSANYGSGAALLVDIDPVRNILLKFDVQVSGEVVGATLRLYQVDSSSRGGDFHTASDSWTESTVTWNNAPPEDPLVFFSLGSVSSNTWYNVDMTSVVTGNGVISLRVTSPSDDGSQFSSKEGSNAPQLVVKVANTPPALQVPLAEVFDEQNLFSFTVVATDDPSQMIVIDVTGLPVGASFTSTPAMGTVTGTLAWTPAESQGPGTYSVTFRATDNLGAQTTGGVVISLQEVNGPPVVVVPGNQTAWEGVTLTFLVTAADPDIPLNSLTLSASGLTANMQFDPITGLFAFTPDSNQTNATFTLTFTVVDDGNPSLLDSKTVWISVFAAFGGGGGHYVT